MMSCNTGLAAARRCAHHAGRVDGAVVSRAAWVVFPICSKRVQVSTWVLNRIMSVSGRSVPLSFLAHYSLKNFIVLI